MRQRRDWFARQLDLDPTRLVFIDETWASTNMARMRGRCRRGRRLRAAVPHGHYKTVTLVAGLRLCGLVAQKAFDRPINAASFEEWVEKCLVPTLSKGDIVVMDNLSSHKGPRVEQLIKAAGAELRYLPPYSPDMNPIEKAYSTCSTTHRPRLLRLQRKSLGWAAMGVAYSDAEVWLLRLPPASGRRLAAGRRVRVKAETCRGGRPFLLKPEGRLRRSNAANASRLLSSTRLMPTAEAATPRSFVQSRRTGSSNSQSRPSATRQCARGRRPSWSARR